MKKKLLITGASGFLGWNMATFPQENWELFGVYSSNPSLPKNIEPAQLDLLNFAKTEQYIHQLRPDAILHLAANSSTHICEESPLKTQGINVDVPAFLANIANQINAHFLFTSSEQVFDGTQLSYTEKDLPNPKNAYGKQKAAAEEKVLNFDNSCVVRIAVLFGNAGADNRNFLHEWLQTWQKQEPIHVFHDEIRSFLSGQSAAEGLFQLLNNKAEGIFHLAGANPISRLKFAELLKKHANIPTAKIISKSQKDVHTLAFRPENLSLDCTKAEKFGFVRKGVEEELMKMNYLGGRPTVDDRRNNPSKNED